MLHKITSGVITTPIFLKIASCMMGFFIWYSVSDSRTITRTITVPIYFDNITPNIQIHAPESTQITLSGTQRTLNACHKIAALHFDGAQLSLGTKLLHATYKNFLLPSAVKVLNYNPIEISITDQQQ